jgi:hypothetical protein
MLGWTIIIVATRRFRHEPPLLAALSPGYNKLLWSTISEGPQIYHVVKALCLICTWPLPTTFNPSDATFSLSSMMMSIALQNILDFPVQLQFSKAQITEAEQRDRRLTWAACNIVAQWQVYRRLFIVFADQVLAQQVPMGFPRKLTWTDFWDRTSHS